MEMALSGPELAEYVARQVGALFPFPGDPAADAAALAAAMPEALDWADECFARIAVKCFRLGGRPFFSPLVGDAYAMFLYMLARTLHQRQAGGQLKDRLYLLNRALNGLDLFYEVQMPRVFLLVHPLGTVLGRATYGERLVVYQGVTVGGNAAYEYPEIGRGTVLFSNCSVIGRSRLGDGVRVAARACVMDADVPAGHVAFGLQPAAGIRAAKRELRGMCFVD